MWITLGQRLAWGKPLSLGLGTVAMRSDTDYFFMRIEQERQAASRATDDRVRLRHLEFAAAYVFYLREMKAQEQRVALHFSSNRTLRDPAPEPEQASGIKTADLPPPDASEAVADAV